MKILVQQPDFDIGVELATLQGAAVGATVSFIGKVRSDDGVTRMELEHYPGMTERALESIAGQAALRWEIIDVTIIHRIGMLEAGDQIVLVAVSGRHRGAAFSACEFIMDYLKTEAPFWKKEYRADGARWVDARSSDLGSLDKWR